MKKLKTLNTQVLFDVIKSINDQNELGISGISIENRTVLSSITWTPTTDPLLSMTRSEISAVDASSGFEKTNSS